MIRIEPYKQFSGGARALAIRAGILRATPKQVRKHKHFGTIINWGNSDRRFENAKYINTPEAVSIATDKRKAAEIFAKAEVPVPAYYTNRESIPGCNPRRSGTDKHLGTQGADAPNGCGRRISECVCKNTDSTERGRGTCTRGESCDVYKPIVCRTLTRASGGRGIVLANTPDEIVDAPLYFEYVKKAHEYRVHVFNNQVIDVQQKRKRQEVPNEEVNYQIRNANNGWVYCRGGVDAPHCVTTAAIDAVRALGLTFGAADIGYNVKQESAMVYEVNTAPGLEGSTLDSYYAAFLEYLPQLNGGAYARRRRMDQRKRMGA